MQKADLVQIGLIGNTFDELVISAVVFRESGLRNGFPYDSPLGEAIGALGADQVLDKKRQTIWDSCIQPKKGLMRRSFPAVVVYSVDDDGAIEIDYVERQQDGEIKMLLRHLGFGAIA